MYTIEYIIGKSGTMMKRGTDLTKMLLDIQRMGCRISAQGISCAMAWSESAADGEKYYIGCVCTIRKGQLKMTEYTSY